MNMRSYARSIIALFAMLLFGCAVPVSSDPNRFNLDPVRLSPLKGAQALALKNAYSNEGTLTIRFPGGVSWIVDQKDMTDTAIAMLGRAMAQQGIAINPQAKKAVTLRARVLSAGARGFQGTIVRVGMDATFGDGTSTYTEGDNTSPLSQGRAFDGAVLFALEQLVLDEKFVAYVNR